MAEQSFSTSIPDTDPVKQSTGSLDTEPVSATEERARKRDFFRFGRKDDDKKKSKEAATASSGGLRPVSPLAGLDPTRSPGSPARNSPYGIATSPRAMRSASPRTHSPASSMIFERNVQEDVSVPQASPQIPSHIITENHIPPALDATSEAITDRKLDPDAVEIVTHAAHQPAAVTITESQPISPVLSEDNIAHHMSPPRSEPIGAHDIASNYANLDSVDVRRLSFISFADVVHGEHDLQDSRRDSAALTSHPSVNVPTARSPSPFRSLAEPVADESSPYQGASDLNIETMRQALRKTGSGDLSAYRGSSSLNALGNEDNTAERTLR